MESKSNQSNAPWLLLIFLLFMVAIGYDIQTTPEIGPQFSAELSDVILPSPKTLQSFELQDHHRKPFDLERFKGRWTFLFFGYTHCPDVCPTAMGILAEFFDRLKKEAPDALKNTHLAFVSVDPERDTPEHLRQYVSYFNPEFLGITGKTQELKKFSKQLGVIYFKGAEFKDPERPQAKPPAEPSEEDKMVSHTSAFFLIDPLGRLIAIFPEYNNTDMIFSEYTRIRKFVQIHNLYGEK